MSNSAARAGCACLQFAFFGVLGIVGITAVGGAYLMSVSSLIHSNPPATSPSSPTSPSGSRRPGGKGETSATSPVPADRRPGASSPSTSSSGNHNPSAYDAGWKDGYLIGQTDKFQGRPRRGAEAVEMGKLSSRSYDADPEAREAYVKGYTKGYNDGYTQTHATPRR
jgi:hypothetical protein